MPEGNPTPHSTRLGRIVSISIIAAAVISGLFLIAETNRYPRTDDAEVFANFIGIAPQVDGPITRLAVQDNAFIKQGEVLFEIDPRPYEYALQKAHSELNTLEGHQVAGAQLHDFANASLVSSVADRNNGQVGGDLVTDRNDPFEVFAARHVNKQLRVYLSQGVSKIAKRRYPSAMDRLTGTPQRAVDRLDGIPRGAHYNEWNRVLVCQDASQPLTLLNRQENCSTRFVSVV